MPERVIGGKKYELQRLPARRQFAALGRIQQLRRSTGFQTPLDLPEDLVDTLLETATIDGEQLLPVIDEVLSGKMGDMVSVLAFALEVNFAGFFSARPGKGKAEPAVVDPAVPSEG
jgi:hypothetical protein